MKNFFKKLFKPKTKNDNITYRWLFGCEEWRIESKKKENGLSNLKLFAENKLEFEGRYGDLIKIIRKYNNEKKDDS